MPIIQYASDLHLEFPLNTKWMEKYPLQVKGDILILAGDIIPFAIMDKHAAFFDDISARFATTYWLPGNHEYYHGDLAQRTGIVREQIRDNVWLVNNVAIVQGGVQLIFSTLWSHMDPADSWQIERAMSDFHVIKHHGERCTIPAFNALHADSVAFIKDAVAANPSMPVIVATHHVPTFFHYPEKYAGNVLNQAFATELGDFIAASGIHSWVFGHYHCNMPAFHIGDTAMLTNQLGYVRHGEHSGFSRDKVIAL